MSTTIRRVSNDNAPGYSITYFCGCENSQVGYTAGSFEARRLQLKLKVDGSIPGLGRDKNFTY